MRAMATRRPAVERPRRVRRTPEEARALLLEAARKLIGEHGPDGVGLKDVAREAGVSHALVSHYFGTWDKLVEETIRSELQRERTAMIERIRLAPTLEPEAWLETLFEHYSDPRSLRTLFWALMSGRLDGPDAFPRKDQGLRQIVDVVEARVKIELGGRAPPREDLESVILLAVASTWGYMLGRGMLWAALGREASAERDRALRRRLVATVWKGLLDAAGEP